MGEYFTYVNHTKRLRFDTSAIGNCDKFHCIGTGLPGRAFCLLLTRSHHRGLKCTEAGLGAWIGDDVLCCGDHSVPQEEYDWYPDITANVIVLLYRVDGADDLVEVAKGNSNLLVQLTHLVNTGVLPELAHDLSAAFGDTWRQRAKRAAEQSWRPCVDIVDVPL